MLDSKIIKIARLIHVLESDIPAERKVKQLQHARDAEIITDLEAIDLICEYDITINK